MSHDAWRNEPPVIMDSINITQLLEWQEHYQCVINKTKFKQDDLIELVQALAEGYVEMNERVKDLEKKLEELYFAPGQPGYVKAEIEFQQKTDAFEQDEEINVDE